MVCAGCARKVENAIILSLFLQSVKKVLKNYLQNGKNREDRQNGKD